MQPAMLDFLRTILPTEGVKCAAIFRNNKVAHRFTTSLEDLAAIIATADGLGETVYHACAAFKTGENRKSDNALGARAFWLDIDAGDGKPYVDAVAAAQAVGRFCRSVNFPAPLYVGSGVGLHVYWPLVETLDPIRWRGYADRLRELCRRHGLEADSVRTADISSILRPPGTHNRKGGVARLVEWSGPVGPYKLEQLGELNDDSVPVLRGSVRARERLSRPARPLVAAALNIYGSDPCYAEPIAAQCRQLGEMARSHGRISEPQWYAALGVLGACADGDKFAHLWSAGYNGYTAEETNERLERARDFGPTTCAHFERLNPVGCEGCALRGTITSPIQAGRAGGGDLRQLVSPVAPENVHYTVARVVSTVPTCPEGLSWDAGALVRQGENISGQPTTEIISRYPLYLQRVQTGEISGDNFSLQFALELPQEPIRDIVLPAETIFSSNGISKMSGRGAVIHDPEAFKRYVRAAIDMWNADNKLDRRYEQYGWKEYGSFLFGPNLYTRGGVVAVAGADEVKLRNQWLGPAKGGSLNAWSRAANALFTKGCEPQSFALLASFAAPLMRFHSSGEGGAIVSLVNDQSGSGKTTALEAVASVWGREEGLKLTDDDTKVSKGLTLGVLGNLPCIYDELYTRDPEIIKNFVLMFTNGRDKMRGTQDGQLRHTRATWQTILVLASNLSIVDVLSSMDGTDAPAYRVMEFYTEIPKGVSKGDSLKRALKDNSGYAGDAYLRTLVKPEVLKYITECLPKWTEDIWRRTGLDNEHRFWVRTISSVVAASVVVNKLGLVDFSPDRIVSWAIEAVRARRYDRTITGHRDPAAVLANFLGEHIADTLVVPGPWKPQAKVMPIMEPRRQLLIRYEAHGGRIYVNETHIKKWLVKHGVPIREFVRYLQEHGIIVRAEKRITLGAGTDYATGQITSFEIDGHHPAIRGGLRGVEEKLPPEETPTRAQRISAYTQAMDKR